MAKKKAAPPSKTTARKPRKPKRPQLEAWILHDHTKTPIEPASPSRDWMDQTRDRFAYRCLPLVIANQHGWIIRSPISFKVRWNGGPELSDTTVKFPKGKTTHAVISHFGSGIITFIFPYLFRTSPGINLWVKGPSNSIKDGIQALEGVIETDWLESTFTMNWKMTRRNHTVSFEAGDPICMIVPITRGLVDSIEATMKPITANAPLNAAYQKWGEERRAFNLGLKNNDPKIVEQGWQRDYMLGRKIDGQKVEGHQTHLNLAAFIPPKPESQARSK